MDSRPLLKALDRLMFQLPTASLIARVGRDTTGCFSWTSSCPTIWN